MGSKVRGSVNWLAACAPRDSMVGGELDWGADVSVISETTSLASANWLGEAKRQSDLPRRGGREGDYSGEGFIDGERGEEKVESAREKRKGKKKTNGKVQKFKTRRGNGATHHKIASEPEVGFEAEASCPSPPLQDGWNGERAWSYPVLLPQSHQRDEDRVCGEHADGGRRGQNGELGGRGGAEMEYPVGKGEVNGCGREWQHRGNGGGNGVRQHRSHRHEEEGAVNAGKEDGEGGKEGRAGEMEVVAREVEGVFGLGEAFSGGAWGGVGGGDGGVVSHWAVQ